MGAGPGPAPEAICAQGFIVEVSPDGAAWDDISEWVRSVDWGEHTRATLTYNTAGGDPKVCLGRADPMASLIDLMYTEDDTDPYAVFRAAHWEGTPLYVRTQVVTPSGKRWTSTRGVVNTFDEVMLDADSDEPLGVVVTLTHGGLNWAAPTP